MYVRSAFLAPVTFTSSITTRKTTQRRPVLKRTKCPHACMLDGRTAATRRSVLQLAAIALSTSVIPNVSVSAKEAPSLEGELASIVASRNVLNPVGRYIRTGQWDRARTNVNYATKVLALKRRIRGAAEFLDGDAYYTFLELATELEDTLVQLDATVYTPIFISGADDDEYGVSVEQRKYQTAAVQYLDTVLESFDTLFSNVDDAVLQNARSAAKKQKFEIPIEDS